MVVGDCISYVISNGSNMSMVKTMPLSADVHPHPQIWIGFMGVAKLAQSLRC